MLSGLLVILTFLHSSNGFSCCRGERRKKYWKRRPLISSRGHTRLPLTKQQVQAPPSPRLTLEQIIEIVHRSCTEIECNLSNKHLGDGINAIVFPSSIQILRLSHNDITMLNIRFPEGLTELQLNANKLKLSPANPLDLSYLVNLQKLCLDGNEISNFYAIHFPPQLKVLSVASNRLSSFDDIGDLSYLRSLTVLILDGNELEEINGNISKRLPDSLRYLGLASNKIYSLAISVPTSLQKLNLSENPLRKIRIDNINECVPGLTLEIEQNGLEPKTQKSAMRSPRLIWNASLEKNCQICCEELEKGDIVRTLPCLHQFHCNCITQWLEHQKTCPTCRHNIFDD